MSWNDKLFGWLRREPDGAESEDLKQAEADYDEEYSAMKAGESLAPGSGCLERSRG